LIFSIFPLPTATAPKKAGNGTVELQIGVSSRKKKQNTTNEKSMKILLLQYRFLWDLYGILWDFYAVFTGFRFPGFGEFMGFYGKNMGFYGKNMGFYG